MELETGQREARTRAVGLRSLHYQVEFRFALQQDVTIKALKLKGCIVARGEKIGGHIYSVVWWAENKRNECWLYEHELEG